MAAIVISVAAFAINLINLIDRRRQDRRDLFLKLHERLIDPDLQNGRRLLYQRVHNQADAGRLREDHPDDYQLVNRALAMFDVFSLYVEKGYVDRDVALEEWGHVIARAWSRAQHVIADRDQDQTWQVWPHLRAFAGEATRWHEAHRQPPSSGR